MKCPALFCIAAILFLTQPIYDASGNDWLNSPQPAYPLRAVFQGSSGVVRLCLVLYPNGKVKEARLLRSSGSKMLDNEARAATMEWKMDRAKIRPADLTTGRLVEIEFRKAKNDLGIADAVLRSASKKGSAWRSGGRIDYPYDARRRGIQGTCRLEIAIGQNGHPRVLQVLQSSGSKLLDDAAVAGIQTWTAFPQFIGESVAIPIHFVLGR